MSAARSVVENGVRNRAELRSVIQWKDMARSGVGGVREAAPVKAQPDRVGAARPPVYWCIGV
jgi:hypothetical protein